MFSDSALLFWSFVTLAATFGVGAYLSEGRKARNLWIGTAACLLLAFVLGFGLPSYAPRYVAPILRIVWTLYPLFTVAVVALMLPRRVRAGERPAPGLDLSPIESRISALEQRPPAEAEAADLAPINQRLDVIEQRLDQLEVSAQQAGNKSVGNLHQMERRIASIASAVNVLVEPMLASFRVRQLEQIEIPQPQTLALEYDVDGRRTAVERSWPDFVVHMPGVLTNITGDTSGDLQRRLEQTAARIRGDALYTTPTDEEKEAGITGAEKQRWHIIKEQLGVINSYRTAQITELQKWIRPDGGAGNAKHFLEENV